MEPGEKYDTYSLVVTDKKDASSSNSLSYTYKNGKPLEEFLEDIERDILTNTLAQCRWNKTAAAEQLGMSFRSIRYKLKKLGID